MADRRETTGRRSYDRREFLRHSATTALLLGGGATLLSACGSDSKDPVSTSQGGPSGNAKCGEPPKLSRPNNPATLPLCADPIKDGLDPESGTLKIFNYADYLDPETVKTFEKEYKVKVELTTFANINEAVDKLQSGAANFDLINMSPDRLGTLAAAGLIQPLNKTYIANLSNVWASLQDPFYDKGSQYTIPYTIYTTGIGYRTDKVDPSDAPPTVADATDMLFNRKHKGYAFVLDDDREALSMALLRLGFTDVNTEDPAIIAKAGTELQRMVGAVNIKISGQGYTKLPEGQAWVHQTWSGDMINAVYNLPEDLGPEVLGYWFQPDGKGLIQSDSWTIGRKAAKPVLAHRFLNFILDETNARTNIGFTGYQQPLTAITPETLIEDGVIPENLLTAVVREQDFVNGYEELQLSPKGKKIWEDEWAKFTSGAGS